MNDHIWLSRSKFLSLFDRQPRRGRGINTGVSHQGPRHRERFEQAIGRPLNVHTLIITQSHPDHYGGWGAFNAAGIETIVADNYELMMEERRRLGRISTGGGRAACSRESPSRAQPVTVVFNNEIGKSGIGGGPTITPTRRVSAPYRFEADGRHLRGPTNRPAENRSTACWFGCRGSHRLLRQPDGRELRRGARICPPSVATAHAARGSSSPASRKCWPWSPTTLHWTRRSRPRPPADQGRNRQGRLCGSRYIYDYTLDGIGAGKSLEQLITEIKLPKALEPHNGRGPHDVERAGGAEDMSAGTAPNGSPTSTPFPQSGIWPDIIEMAGGAKAVLARANALLAAGRNVDALRFTDMLLAQIPQTATPSTSKSRLSKNSSAADASKHYDLSRFLEMEIKRAKK